MQHGRTRQSLLLQLKITPTQQLAVSTVQCYHNNTKELQFITLLTATCIVSHTENSKNDKGYIT